ncbi:hypothetical protein [Lactobacillus delbrueckii]|uniref:hypothetical protein n=2 Tax=Lactobacillus delbrueckii TaxID=1584 RepID=UPI0021A7C208|nr:hypothetical protein [Lactobacillus delbrueckii]
MIMTVFLYQKLSPLVSLNALSAFFLATGLILLTLIPVIFLYISQEQTVITEDSHFFWSTILCMILVVAQAEFPRMFLDGNNSAVPTPISYVVSFLAIISCIMYIFFMKFNIFSINRYESYLKKYDDDQLTGAKSLHYFMEHYEEPQAVRQKPKFKYFLQLPSQPA